MRDPERIDRITKRINELWKTAPDMRFGQLLINLGIAPDDFDFWYVEDEKIEKDLNKKKGW